MLRNCVYIVSGWAREMLLPQNLLKASLSQRCGIFFFPQSCMKSLTEQGTDPLSQVGGE